MAMDNYPPAAGQSYRPVPVKKWAVIGGLILLLITGGLAMLAVGIAMILIVPLLAVGALYGVYRAVQHKLHRDQPRLENKT